MSMTIALDEIPGPKGLPLVGNVFDIDADNPIEAFIEMAAEYGPIYKLDIPGAPASSCRGQRSSRRSATTRGSTRWSAGPASLRKGAVGNGLFTSETDDPLWRRAHNILMAPSASRPCATTCRACSTSRSSSCRSGND